LVRSYASAGEGCKMEFRFRPQGVQSQLTSG
jgi:hypothetical protein